MYASICFAIVPPTLSHTDGSTGNRTVLTRNGASQVTLTTNQFGSIPPVADKEIYWNRSGSDINIDGNSMKYITTGSDQLSQLNLTIISPTTEDSGLYTFIITHEAGTVTLNFKLKVLGNITNKFTALADMHTFV